MQNLQGDDDDDGAVLRAVLAFIGDFEFNDEGDVITDAGGDFSQPHDATLATPAATVDTVPADAPPSPPPPPPSRPHSYSRRRDELQYLRGHVQELERQLGALRRRVEDQAESKSEPQVEGRMGPSPLVLEAWERVAQKQYEQRRRAEHDNAELKRLLEDQIKVGKALKRVLSKKRPRDIEALRLEMERPRNVVPAFGDTSQLFRDLFASIDKQYLEMDRMYAKIKHECPTVNHHDASLVHDPDAGLTVQVTECRIFPFAYEDTAQAVWDSIVDSAVYGPHDIDKTDVQQTLKLRVKTRGSGHTATDVFLASRRYTEAKRTVIISAAVVDPSQIADINMDGIHMRYLAWSIIEPLPPSSRATTDAARMTAYTTASPVVNGNAMQDPTRKVGALTNFVMRGVAFDKEARHATLENRLFALSLGGAR